MAIKKSTSKIARDKWIEATKDPSLSPGQRIRLFWNISRQAAQIIKGDKTGNAKAKVREDIVKLCKSMKSGGKPNVRFHKSEIGQFLRLCKFSKDEVSELAKDADRPRIKGTGDEPVEPGLKSRMTISHALLLAAVTDDGRRKQLLGEAIDNHWSIDVLTDKSRNDREGLIGRPVQPTGEKLVRHRTTINSLTKTTADLLKLLDELEDAAFVQTITKSDRRDRADTLKRLRKLVSTFGSIREKLPAAEEAAKAAAKNLGKFIRQNEQHN